jgi:hypothetical protein
LPRNSEQRLLSGRILGQDRRAVTLVLRVLGCLSGRIGAPAYFDAVESLLPTAVAAVGVGL